MAEADQKLKEDLQNLPSGSLDIENIDDTQEHVEMVNYIPLSPPLRVPFKPHTTSLMVFCYLFRVWLLYRIHTMKHPVNHH